MWARATGQEGFSAAASDWTLARGVTGGAIDACEAMEARALDPPQGCPEV